ncbi:MAG: glucanotransferase [Lachnospiraceae bacterium]|nr:glucanotransferase [Lachnospiraceae bacterium]
MKKIICLFIILSFSFFTTACNTSVESFSQKEKDYGVFLSIDASEMEKLNGYQTVVIDAQYFSKQDIQTLHKNGTVVYTYLNIGSIENFRDYYSTYKSLTLGDYENWEEEKWIDVSNKQWQTFIANLSNSLLEKEVDGFFIDNCDVYYYQPTEEIFLGLSEILRGIKTSGKKVIINGGNTYITRYRETYGSAKNIMTAVNQEEVFSIYDFDASACETNTDEEKAYFCDYIEACSADGMDVYLLEYTTDRKLITQIETYCKEKGFRYYISDSIELD